MIACDKLCHFLLSYERQNLLLQGQFVCKVGQYLVHRKCKRSTGDSQCVTQNDLFLVFLGEFLSVP